MDILKDIKDYKMAGTVGIIVAFSMVIGFLFLKIRRLMLAFIIGSSVASTIFSLSYLSFSNLKFGGIKNFESIAIYIPLLYGGFNILNVALIRNFGKSTLLSIFIPFLIGALQGITFSFIGKYFMNNIAIKNLNFKKSNEWKSHLYAAAYYSAVYGVVITLLNKLYFVY